MIGFNKGARDIARLNQIVDVLFKHEMGFFLEKMNLKRHLPVHKRIHPKGFKRTETQPAVIRKALDELGGGFIKVGQLLSLRPDLIPNEYCEEFRKLQDN
ncbi:AarF/ABC1/UbiB kinase family protein, partial [Candidatus Woesearchaeota archaeon]|nr:AarF/ABC1/UbiB kinase family protein [Candidatus Woesearchaeota archaeon]